MIIISINSNSVFSLSFTIGSEPGQCKIECQNANLWITFLTKVSNEIEMAYLRNLLKIA